MKKILIIADGILAKHFLERVIDSTSSDNTYDVIMYNDETMPSKKPDNFTFYDFDPTSFDKIRPFLNRDYFQIMILVTNKIDAMGSYNNIRLVNKEVQIVLLDRWEFSVQDHRLEILNSRDVLSSRFVDFLPDMPVVAQNVGIGAGEIMQIRVPIGSSYVYRHLASITQKKWKVAGIYRANKLILPRPTLMIQPNDMLLVVGDPGVLLSVYKSVKRELGQFPAPFGSSIYCMIDMKDMSSQEIDELVNDALFLHSNISSVKLHIKIVNPTYSEIFEKLKSYASSHINIEIDYHDRDVKKIMKKDLDEKDIGLIVVANRFFMKNTAMLHNSKLPVFKIGVWGFQNLKDGVVLSSSAEDIERESAAIFDISAQLDLHIKLYNFNPDEEQKKNALAEHFESLSKLFSQKVEVINTTENPLLKLRNKKDILQFVPFNKKILKSGISSVFSTDMDRLFFKLSDSYQLFIPTQEA